jgi:phytoene desaturase
MKAKRVIVVGGGFAGMSSAAYLAKAGYSVKIIEKNHTLGGRCRVLEHQGFKFDMGPSWYWMPDVFESFFNDFNHTTQDFYNLIQLDPGFEIVFDNDKISVPAAISDLYEIFETIEKGSSNKLKDFMHEAELKYKIAIHDIVYRPFVSCTEIFDSRLIGHLAKMSLFTSMSQYVRRYFKNDKLIKLMEFPVIFLGGMPGDIPALYSLMNYAAFELGTWYPQGGMFEIVRAIQKILNKLNVEIHTDEEVLELAISNKNIEKVITNRGEYYADVVIAAADYHFVDRVLLDEKYSNYSKRYWEKRFMAPSALIFYMGLNQSIPKLSHHTLFFDADFEQHSKDIYESPKWPDSPLFYLSCTSKTDKTVAPEGSENIVILIPVASGMNDNPEKQNYYFNIITQRIKNYIQMNISDHVIFKKAYSISNFTEDYHSFKGNAYGLANTLFQTAILKPSMLNKKVHNIVYTGQLTVPGPGVPPALISGKIAANLVRYKLKI